MQKTKSLFTLLLLAVAIIAFQSCKKDDDSSPTSGTTKPEGKYNFFEIQDREWRMWTNGSEVNTSGMDIGDYIPSEKMYELSQEGNAAESEELTFTQDSIFTIDDDMLVGFPYRISNDSIYVDISYDFGEGPVVFTQFLGIKTASGFYVPQSFFRYAEHDDIGNMFVSSSEIGYLTVDRLKDEYELFESISDLQQGDTLIILNQKLIYK